MWLSLMQTRFLHEDFNNRVVPYRYGPTGYELSTEGLPSHQVVASLRLDHQARSLDDFLRAIASRLLTHHEVLLEVTIDDEHRPFGVFELDRAGQTGTGIGLTADRMIQVLLPDAYPSQLLTQVVRDLAEIDFNLIPAWAMRKSAGERRKVPHFDITEAGRTKQLRIAQAALPIGWTAQEFGVDQSRQLSEYYHYWRELRFLHFRSSMLARAEDALLKVLALAGTRCGFTASVTANGIHTPEEVQEFIRKFEAGELSFSDVNDIVFGKGNGAHSEQRRVV